MASELMAASSPEEPVEIRSEARCKVCAAPERDLPNGAAVKNLVEELLLVPKPYAAILRLVEPLLADWPEEYRFSKYSLRRHAQRHLRWEQTGFRAIADRRAHEAERVNGAAGRMLNAATVLETVQQLGLDLLLQGELRPTVRDVLAATNVLRELEQEANEEFSPAVLVSQLNDIIEVVREVVPPESWPHMVALLEEKEASFPRSRSDSVWDELEGELSGEDE